MYGFMNFLKTSRSFYGKLVTQEIVQSFTILLLPFLCNGPYIYTYMHIYACTYQARRKDKKSGEAMLPDVKCVS